MAHGVVQPLGQAVQEKEFGSPRLGNSRIVQFAFRKVVTVETNWTDEIAITVLTGLT